MKLPELLSPAGSIDHLKAAVNAGADAVYMGGDRFSARAYAQNFSKDRIREALHYAHFYDRKIYLTVNTLMKENELEEELYDFLLPYEEAGLDGVIVQDLGTASFIHSAFPGMEIHGSTQMTITDVYGARAAARMGMTRIVPARELSIQELKEIRSRTGLELEVFVHGALCYCYSGQCLFSSLYGGRSGNRGRCAQPCRLPYRLIGAGRGQRSSSWEKKTLSGKESYLLSPRDLAAIDLLPDLCRLPVDSLKIEGRMKNVEYVAGVTAIYRKSLDRIREEFLQKGSLPDHWQVSLEDRGDLQDLYSRGDFTDGYFYHHNGRDMMSLTSPRNTGRLLGHVEGRRKNHLKISFETRPEPRDILVIPLGGREQEEIVLTVPAELKLTRQGKKLTGELNAPGSARVQPGMAVYRRRKDALIKKLQTAYAGPGPRLTLHAQVHLKKGRPAVLELFCGDEKIQVQGEPVQEAAARPLQSDDVVKQIAKTGNTSFTLDRVDLDMDENIFLPVSALKHLRREGCEQMQKLLESRKDRPAEKRKDWSAEDGTDRPAEGKKELKKSGGHLMPAEAEQDGAGPAAEESSCNSREIAKLAKMASRDYNHFVKDSPVSAFCADNGSHGQPGLYVTVYSREMADFCAGQEWIKGLCLPEDFFEAGELKRMAAMTAGYQKEVCLRLPRILRGNAERISSLLKERAWDGVYINGIGQAQLIDDLIREEGRDCSSLLGGKAGQGSLWIAAAPFYQWNRRTTDQIRSLYPWINGAEYPVELSEEGVSNPHLLDLYGERELLVYGRIPVMVSAQCLKKSQGLCDHREDLFYLEDRKGRRLPVTSHCRDCMNQIWKDSPRDLIGTDVPVGPGGISRLRMDLLDVNIEDFQRIKERYLYWEKSGFRKNLPG